MEKMKQNIQELTPQQKAALLLKRRKQQAALQGLQNPPSHEGMPIFDMVLTNHFISKPAQFGASPEVVKTVLESMKNGGINWGFNFNLEDIPYICYTSRVDNAINMDDFKGKISFGNSVGLNSSLIYPFHNGPVRITLVKKQEGRVGSLYVGDNVYLPGTAIVSYEKITIESNVLLGSMVTIMDSSGHGLTGRNTADEMENLHTAPVTIKEGAWIGYGATILKGVTIGKNCVVGAHSVVHKSIPDNTVAAGNPARVIKTLE